MKTEDVKLDTRKTCYLFFDFDGTVSVHQRVPEEHIEAMRAAQRLGHKLILNTGRSRGGFSFEKHQEIDWDGTLFGGSDMTFGGKHVHEHTMADEDILKWMRYGMERRYWVKIEAEKRNKRYDFDQHPEDFTPEEEQMILRDLREVMIDNPVTKLTLRRVDVADTPTNGIRVIRQENDSYTELFPNGRDKGVGFLDFCENFHIPKEQCICFGDSANDLAIFQVCPTGICMSHSPESLKKYSTYCAKGEFGVAEGLRWLFGKALNLTNAG